MDEIAIAMKARDFIAKCGPSSLPVLVDAYAAQIGGVVKAETLQENEDAWSFRGEKNGKYRICVNCAHDSRRQRFSVCHEVAHEVLENRRRPYRSELELRPPAGEAKSRAIFRRRISLSPQALQTPRRCRRHGVGSISYLAEEFDASSPGHGSRFATFSRELCAYVLSEKGKVRYSSRSTPLARRQGLDQIGLRSSKDSYSARVRAGGTPSGPEEADPDQWFEDWDRDGSLYEDVRHLGQWDQTLTLLWFDDEDLPPSQAERARWEENTYGLRELDGNLPWPGKSKRRR